MSINVSNYQRKRNDVQAAFVNASNAKDVAQWCGGRVDEDPKPGDPTDVHVTIVVPNIDKNFRAQMGDYIVKDKNGRFSVQKCEEFLEEYEVVGLREANRSGVLVADLPKSIPTPHYVQRGAYPNG